MVWEEQGGPPSNSSPPGHWSAAAYLGSRGDAPVRDVTWSPDGTRVVTGSLDGRTRVWQFTGNKTTLTGANVSVEVSFEENGTIEGYNRTQFPSFAVSSWSVVAMHTSTVETIAAVNWAWNSSMPTVLSFALDRTACVSPRNLTGQGFVSFQSCGSQGVPLERSHGSSTDFSSYKRVGALWQPTNGSASAYRWSLSAVVEGQRAAFLATSVRWSPDGQSVLMGCNDGVARIWQYQGPGTDGTARWAIVTSQKVHAEAVWLVEWSPDGSQVLTAGRDGLATIWQLGGGPWVLATTLPPSNTTNTTTPAPPSTSPWTLIDPSVLSAWRVNSNLDRSTNMDWVTAWSPVWTARWSPDGSRILTGSRDGTARIWLQNPQDPTKWSIESMLQGHAAAIWSVAWSPDSEQVLTADQTGIIRIWRVQSSPS